MPRTYDLTRPGDVHDLLRRQDHERASGAFSRATVEFAYWAGGGDTPAVADVRRELSELTFPQRQAATARAWIRFPEARYLGRPRIPEPAPHPRSRRREIRGGTTVSRR
ncbi:hypothetical protein [Streptomyces sp.]